MAAASLKGKTLFITGASRGIGLAIGLRAARDGANVAIAAKTTEPSGKLPGTIYTAAKEIEAAGGRALPLAVDVRDEAAVKAALEATASQFGGIDIVVNNAGIGVFTPVANLTTEDWHRVIETNLTGVFHCSQEGLSRFGTKGGYIFQIGSLAGKNAFAGGAVYNASKFALNGFSEAMMLDHRYDNVRVTTICPGSVDTDFGPRTAAAPWKIQPQDIADIVLSLLRLPSRTLVSYVEVRPSQPKRA